MSDPSNPLSRHNGAPTDLLSRWVSSMNTALERHPIGFGTSFAALDMFTVLGVAAVAVAVRRSVPVPMDLTIAVNVERALRGPRLPLDLAAAALLANAFPQLTQLNVNALFDAMPRMRDARLGKAEWAGTWEAQVTAAASGIAHYSQTYALPFILAKRVLVAPLVTAAIWVPLRFFPAAAGWDGASLLKNNWVPAKLASAIATGNRAALGPYSFGLVASALLCPFALQAAAMLAGPVSRLTDQASAAMASWRKDGSGSAAANASEKNDAGQVHAAPAAASAGAAGPASAPAPQRPGQLA